jgi:hypothetical protein
MQIRKRQGKAIEGSTDLGEVYPGWQLCRLEERWKVYALDTTAGGANYGFRVKDRAIDTHANVDAKKMQRERPALYASIEKFLRTYISKNDPLPDIGDVYGDIALSRKQKLTPDQQWRRGLLLLRLRDLELLAKLERHGVWEACIDMLHQGVYKTNITARARTTALSFVTSSNAPRVNLEALTQVEQDYYSGAYHPQACAELQGQLDMLTESAESAGTSVDDEGEALNVWPPRDTSEITNLDKPTGWPNPWAPDNDISDLL